MEPYRPGRFLIDAGGEEEIGVGPFFYRSHPFIPRYLVDFGDGVSYAQSLFDRLERNGKIAWLVKVKIPDSAPDYGVATDEKGSEMDGFTVYDTSDYKYESFEPIDVTRAAAARYPGIDREVSKFLEAMRAEEESRRQAHLAAARIEAAERAARRDEMTRIRLRQRGRTFMPVPRPTATYYRSKRKVAFSVPEMAAFAYGGLARGGRDVIQRGRNDRLERIPDNEGRETPQEPNTIEVNYRLFNNRIATLRVEADPDPTQLVFAELELRDAGYTTVTTKDRLQTLLDTADIPFFIIQYHWDWYLTPRNVENPWDRSNWVPWEDEKTFAITLG